MKKIIIALLLVLAVVEAKHTIIMLDGITVIIPLEKEMVCKKRPQITQGTYLERFFNLENLDIGDSWYWDGCNWKKTKKSCQYTKTREIGIDLNTMKASSLKQHHTLDYDQIEKTLVVVNCSLNNNYNLGEGFNEYNDMQAILIRSSYMVAWGFSLYTDYENNWWLRTPHEIIKKKNYPFTW